MLKMTSLLAHIIFQANNFLDQEFLFKFHFMHRFIYDCVGNNLTFQAHESWLSFNIKLESQRRLMSAQLIWGKMVLTRGWIIPSCIRFPCMVSQPVSLQPITI